MSILLFFIVLFVLILVHEWGHFVVAKKTGMRVDEFGIGFPPRLFGIKRGETEYTFNALPIGGFVRILGEDGAGAPSSPVSDEVGDGRSEASAEAGQGGQNLDEAQTVADYERSFAAKSGWAQAAVLIAGVAMNVIFAWFLLVAVYLIGVPTVVSPEAAGPEAQLVVTTVMPDSPAAAAAVPVGATIVGLTDGERTLETFTPTGFAEFTTATAGESLTLTYRAGGEEETVSLTPTVDVLEADANRPAVGVALALVETEQRGFLAALSQATLYTGTALVAITVGITTLLVDALTLTADLSQVAGPVGIVGLVGDAAQFGLTSLLLFTAIISLNLAVINLLPFPALDGGRLVFVAVEALTRRPINPSWAARLNFVGFVLLILLMVAVTYNDILRIL
jgi:regulator of sigma E protease